MTDSATLRQHARHIFQAGLKAVDPAASIERTLRRQDDRLMIGDHCFDLNRFGRIYVVAIGKAAARMAQTVEPILGDALTAGLAITKDEHGLPLDRIELREASHPVPDERGVQAAQEVMALLSDTRNDDLVLCLMSGGGSALLPCPVDGVTLADKGELTRQLLACGADIAEINSLRKHLSRLKGGGLARQTAPATVVSLILSDVVGDPLDVIASGPTVPDSSTFSEAWNSLEHHGLLETVPSSIRSYLQQGCEGSIPDTPKPGDALFDKVTNHLIGTNRMAVEAAAQKARSLGYQTLILSTTITGETRDVAMMHGALAREIHQTGQPIPRPACLLSGGETTVTLTGHGKGGRNQEFALAAAPEIAGLEGTLVLCGGTDGTDGPTDAAGALADGETLQRSRALGLDLQQALDGHDAYPFFAALDDLLMTGPTGTNVMDLRLVLVA